MIRAELAIRRSETPVREASAWLLGGTDPESWLSELARWCVPDPMQESLSLYLLPMRAGALVVVPVNVSLAVKPSGAAYGRFGRVLLPVDAVLEPELSLQELDTLLQRDVYVLHPSVGWIAFEAHQRLRPSSLLAFPRLARERWRAPSPVPEWNDRIVSVSLTAPVSFDDFFEEVKRDIGSAALDEIPKAEDEPRDGLIEGLKRKAIEPLAHGARALSSRLSGGGEESSWIHRLEDWANQKLRHVSQELERLRNKELHRLLDLLELDAEKGLRHALPLGGGTHRGLAPPGARLSARSVDFELGALGGGRPLDPWDVPFDLQQKLLSKYRELASREKKLGRHRRAAYIYAELIGDLESAAAVLEQGRHFREAAEMYRKHLHKPLMAARSYERGGLFREAVDVYEELELWEECGDVYRKMEQPDRAKIAFEKARDQKLASRDRVGAARIVEAKLEDVEGALEIVEHGWPDSRQADECLRSQLRIQAREGMHGRTDELLKRLTAETTPPHLVASLVSCLATTASSYPNPRVRHEAADLTRRKISSRLNKASRDEASGLLASLYKLSPEDRLLTRDGGRFLSTKDRRMASPRRRRSSSAPELVRSFELPSSLEWLDAQSLGSLFFALARSAGEVQLYRGNWSGSFEHVAWRLDTSVGGSHEHDAASVLGMALDATGHRNVVLTGLSSPAKIFEASRDISEAETIVGTPGWLPRGTLAVSSLSQTWVVLRHHAGRILLSTYRDDGSHLADIADWEAPDEAVHLTLACQNHYIVVGQTLDIGHGNLLVFDLESRQHVEGPGLILTPREHSMEKAITELRVAQPYTRSRVAVTLLEGVVLHWLDTGESYVVSSDLAEPKVNMLRNGALIAVSGSTVRVYRTDAPEPTLTSEMQLPSRHGPVLSVVPGYAPNQFAIFTTRGEVLVFALPSG